MKYIKYFVCCLALFCVLGCSADPGQDGTSDNVDDIPSEPYVTSFLTISSGDISTIAPSSYTGAEFVSSSSMASARSSSRAIMSEDETYLSYIGVDGSTFQPIVFESSNGTKIVFKNALLHDIGDGYSICFVRELQTVKQEPQVIYKESGVDEDTGEIIYEPVEILIDVTGYYGENTALIDLNKKEVYLLVNPETYTGLFVSYSDYDRNVIDTKENIYINAQELGEDGDVIYRISKSQLSEGRLIPMTNNQSIRWPNIDMVSDNTLVFSGTERNNDRYVSLIRNTSPDSAPIAYDPSSFKFDIENNGSQFTVSCDSCVPILEGNIIHYLTGYNNTLFVADIAFTGDGFVSYGFKEYPISISTWLHCVQLLDIEYTPTGLNAIIKVRDDTSGNMSLILTEFSNGEMSSYKEIQVPAEYSDTDEFILSKNRIYWLNGAFTGKELICYADFDIDTIKTFDFDGKSVASSTINVLDDGTVLFWQYMSGTEIGTYSWNVDTEPYPTLLMTDDVDVKQIINIDTL